MVVFALLAARLLAVLGRGVRGANVRILTAFAAGIAFVAHLAVEGPRWTLVPAYALVVAFVVLSVWERPHPEALRLRLGRNRRRRDPLPWGRVVAGFLTLGVAGALALALPVPRLPAPTGPWALGTDSFAWALTEPGGATVGAGGRTMVRIWYPTEPGTRPARDAPWLEDAPRLAPAIAAWGGLPSWVFGHLALVRTHAAWGAPLLAPPDPRGWPVVSFDHGLGGFRSQNTFLAEELASHGVVVVAVEHPGGALLTVLPDGEARPHEHLPPREAPGYDAAVVALGARWTAETTSVLRRLRRGGEPTTLAGAVDLGRLVSVGHSTGGAVAVDVCHAVPGCRAAVVLDAWWGPLSPTRLERGLERPLVAIASDPSVGYFGSENRARFEGLVAGASVPVGDLVLRGAGHHDLNDTALFSPLAARFGHSVGPVRPYDAFDAIRRVVLAVVEGADPDHVGSDEPLLMAGPEAFAAP